MNINKKMMCGCFAAAVAAGFASSAMAKGVPTTWFEEDFDSVSAALENAGVTEYGKWSPLESISVAGESVCIDADEEEPVTYAPNSAHKVGEDIRVESTICFGRAYDWSVLQTSAPEAKAGLCAAKNGDSIYFAYAATNTTAGKMEWQLSTVAISDIGDTQSIVISTHGSTIYYEYEESGSGEYLPIGNATIEAEAEFTTARFVGAGSFDRFASTWTMNAVAQIGEDYYQTIDEAASNVTEGCTVKLLNDGLTWKPTAKRISYSFDTGTGCFAPAAIDDSILSASGLKYTLVDGTFASSVDLTGDGEAAETAFEIGTLADLMKFKKGVGANIFTADEYFKQTADIDLAGQAWEGIGLYAQPFVGNYLGQGHKISNMTLKNNSDENCGFFYAIGDGEVRDLTVESLGFETNLVDAVANTNEICGGVIAGVLINGGKIIGCTAEGALWGTHNTAGIVAFARGGTEIVSCTNKATITGNYTKMAGIAAYCQGGDGAMVIRDCVNFGAISTYGDQCVLKSVKTVPGSDGVAGIIGWNGAGVTIQGCVNNGTLTGTTGSAVGAFIGKIGTSEGVDILGCAANSADKSIGNGFIESVAYAKIAEGMADYCCPNGADDLAVSNKYWLMLAVNNSGAVFTLENEGDWISFNALHGSFVKDPVDAAENLKVVTTVETEFITYTAQKAGPYTPGVGGGTVAPVAGEENVYEVAPDPSSQTVTVQGLGADDTIRVTITNDMTIIGVPADQIQIKLNGSVIDKKYFIGGDDKGFSTALNPATAKAELVEESATEKPLVVGDDVAVSVKSVAGLYYTLVRGSEIGAVSKVIDSKLGTGVSLTLEDADKPAGKAFYVIETTKAIQDPEN